MSQAAAKIGLAPHMSVEDEIRHRLAGQWLIVHEHFSVPVDEDEKALMNLDPDHDRTI